MEHIYDYTIKLIRYVLNGDVPQLPETIDFEKLYAFGKSHGVENMLYVGLRDLNIDVPAETMQKFRTAYEMQIMVEATQALEYECLCAEFEKAGIDFLPLKGIIIRNIYPMPDYRKSGDIDILIRPDDRQKTHDMLVKDGYSVDEFDEFEIHDGYRKPPYILVEIHNRLVEHYNRSYGYFSCIWNHVHLKAGTKHCYEMGKETLYAYIVAHLCKHIRNEGAGIKFLCDIWLINKEYHTSFNKRELARVLQEAQITSFEKMAKGLADYWFGNGYSNKDILVLERFVLESGCFGSVEHGKKLAKSGATESKFEATRFKIKTFFITVFPKYKHLRKDYPILARYKFVLPIVWIHRIIKKIKENGIKTVDIINTNVDINKDEAEQLRVIWSAVK